MKEDVTITQTEETSIQQEEETSTPQGEKTFTQEEVNRIVQERLARVKAPLGKEEELNNREKELRMKELRLTAREIFVTKKLPTELLDILDYSDEKKLLKNIDVLGEVYNRSRMTPGPLYTPASGRTPYSDPVRGAMGLK